MSKWIPIKCDVCKSQFEIKVAEYPTEEYIREYKGKTKCPRCKDCIRGKRLFYEKNNK